MKMILADILRGIRRNRTEEGRSVHLFCNLSMGPVMGWSRGNEGKKKEAALNSEGRNRKTW